jgi:GH24 family phage-related lysozyme (muramidase)
MSLGDVPFTSTATDKAQFFQDLANHALQSYSLQGLVPASLGVTKPSGGPISSASDLLDTVDSWFGQQRMTRGGPATDAIDTPVQDTYAARRYAFLSKEEGVRQWAYDDATSQRILPGQPARGNVTVGVGFNMDDPSSQARFASALPGVNFNAVRSGQQPLNDAQIRTLFDFNAQEAERIVANKLPGVDLNEHQRLALVSMAFNGPSLLGHHLIDAVTSGDQAAAVNAIRTSPGVRARRYREAGLYAGPVDAPNALPPYQETETASAGP